LSKNSVNAPSRDQLMNLTVKLSGYLQKSLTEKPLPELIPNEAFEALNALNHLCFPVPKAYKYEILNIAS